MTVTREFMMQELSEEQEIKRELLLKTWGKMLVPRIKDIKQEHRELSLGQIIDKMFD